jgi:hypothetical protein
VELLDLAFPGILPAFAERCLLQRLPSEEAEGLGVVFLEFCVNDVLDLQLLNTSDRRALETMMRYVLELPSRPAVVLVCMYRPEGARAGPAVRIQQALLLLLLLLLVRPPGRRAALRRRPDPSLPSPASPPARQAL